MVIDRWVRIVIETDRPRDGRIASEAALDYGFDMVCVVRVALTRNGF